jgi:hypothetical protein
MGRRDKFVHSVCGHRPREDEALHSRATKLLQTCELGIRFNTFCVRVNAKGIGHREDRRDQCRSMRFPAESLDKRAVNLHGIDRKSL